MRVGSTFNVALRALRRNKMRSVLTALGIIIGVGAVIARVGIGNGAKAQVEAQIASLGQNVILIFSGSTTSSGIGTGVGRRRHAENRRRGGDPARSAGRHRSQRGSCVDHASSSRKSELVYSHLRRISGLL